MMDRQRLYNEKDLEKARRNNRFHRQEHLHDAIHAIHIKVVKWVPWLFVILFVIAVFKPQQIDMDLINKALYGVGGILFSTLLSRFQEQTL